MFIFKLAKQSLPLQYSCRVELWAGIGVLFRAGNVIIIFAVFKLVAMASVTYALAVCEKYTTAAGWNRLFF